MVRDYVHFSINGQLYKATGQEAFLPLSDFLRYSSSLTGTKVVCAEGDCGACTVMYKRIGAETKNYRSLNSCISAAILLDNCHIITVEGLAKNGELNEIQSSMVRNFGGQCGFCTPGFVMSLVNLYENNKTPNEQNVKNYLTGNLCRCTGYSPIIQAALDVDIEKIKPLSECFNNETHESILQNEQDVPIFIEYNGSEFYAPTNLAQAAEYKSKNPDSRIFSGATDLGVQINKGRNPGKKLMSLHLVKELYEVNVTDDRISVGARTNLSDLQDILESKSPSFSRFLNIFASPQIKNTATLIGNVANGSPIADTIPYLMTADAVVHLYSVEGSRDVPLVDFITGYKTFDLKPSEIIRKISFKVLDENTHQIGLYKVSQRRDLDISCVNSSFIFRLNNKVIDRACIAFGGVGPKTIRLKKIENQLQGKQLSEELILETKLEIAKTLTPISDARGTANFRQQVCQDLFEKFAREELSL